MTATATRTKTGLTVTLPTGEARTFNGKGPLTASHVVAGEWDAEHGGGWNLSLHRTAQAARKAADGRRGQSKVRVVAVGRVTGQRLDPDALAPADLFDRLGPVACDHCGADGDLVAMLAAADGVTDAVCCEVAL